MYEMNYLVRLSISIFLLLRLAPVYQPSPLMDRRRASGLNASRTSLRKYNSAVKLNNSEDSPPGSPPLSVRASRPGSARTGSDLDSGKNVFHRLVAGTTIGESSRLPDKGRINPFQVPDAF